MTAGVKQLVVAGGDGHLHLSVDMGGRHGLGGYGAQDGLEVAEGVQVPLALRMVWYRRVPLSVVMTKCASSLPVAALMEVMGPVGPAWPATSPQVSLALRALW